MLKLNRTILSISRYAINLFFLLMLVMPTTLQSERGFYLVILLTFSFIIIFLNLKIWWISSEIFKILLFICFASLFFILNGLIQNTPGALAVIGVYFLWPIIFIWIIGFSKEIETFVEIKNTLFIGIFISSLSGIILVISKFIEPLEILRPVFVFLGARAGISESGIELTIPNMATVLYGFSFLLAYIYAFPKTDKFPFNKEHTSLLWILLILCIVTLLISGKRGFWLTAMLALPYTAIVCHMAGIRRFSLKKMVLVIFSLMMTLIFGLIIISLSLEIDFQIMVEGLFGGFNFTDQTNSAASRRYTQFWALLVGWTESPLIGAGHGAMAGDKVRIDIQPWAYELYYLALLFQTGLIGFIVYASSVLWLLYMMIKISRHYPDLARLLVPAAVGLLSFLTVNATNPYLSKFDCLWVIFFPLGIVNIGLYRIHRYRI
jgi:hypothetical protein